jgi:hypothetical protein
MYHTESGKGIYLFETSIYGQFGTRNKISLFDYDFNLKIKEYTTGSKIEDGKLVGSCNDGT